ncbi:MAG TPA: hypothetical protein VFE05_05120 [Longimicrobiaceae bacterium]|jgi:hypothetical protein|nr:hypothetical protein [Longimicrobiaceae bacterium]
MTHDLDTTPGRSRLRALCASVLLGAAHVLRSLAGAAERHAGPPVGSADVPEVPTAGAGREQARDGGPYHFTYPAHAAFEVACADGPDAARALASALVVRLTESDAPLVAVPGALPAEPRIGGLEVWLGSIRGEGDALELEASG